MNLSRSKVDLIKLHAPDVHEIQSINLGLQYIQKHDLADYAITLQDDVHLLIRPWRV